MPLRVACASRMLPALRLSAAEVAHITSIFHNPWECDNMFRLNFFDFLTGRQNASKNCRSPGVFPGGLSDIYGCIAR